MIVISGTVRIPADKVAAARPAIRALVEATRREDGCIAYSFGEDVTEPGRIIIAETWRDQAALDAHFSAPHFIAWRAAGAELGVSERALTIYEIASSRSL
jgi:quinol monooxygenase YgiN